MYCKVLDEITLSIPNFSGAAIEIRGWVIDRKIFGNMLTQRSFYA